MDIGQRKMSKNDSKLSYGRQMRGCNTCLPKHFGPVIDKSRYDIAYLPM